MGGLNDWIFTDGNHNNLEVLSKHDLSHVATLKTDNQSAFSFIAVGQKLFAGCSGNNLFVFELEGLKEKKEAKRLKDLKSTSIIYCFYLLDYNTLLCG